MLVNKYYINYYSTVESINMVYAFDAGLKAVAHRGAGSLRASWSVVLPALLPGGAAPGTHAPGPGGRFQLR